MPTYTVKYTNFKLSPKEKKLIANGIKKKKIMRKTTFYFVSSLIFTLFIIIIDLLLSNTVLDYKNCFKYDEYYYELKKNCKESYRFKETFPIVETITDEMGLRVGKKSPQKSKEKKNIFIFGDSFTYGVGLEFEKTFVGLIEEKKKKEYNVFNFGVGSYSPSVHLYKLKNILKKNIIPEKIILFLDLTDVLDEAGRWDYDDKSNLLKLKTNYVYKRSLTKEKFTKRNFKLLTNLFSYINFYLREIKDKTKIKIQNERKIKTSIQGSFTYTKKSLLNERFWKKNMFDYGIIKLEKRLSEIAKISKNINSDLFIVIYPWAETLEFGQDEFNWSEYVKKICIKNKCKLIDAIPNFKSYKNQNINWSNELYFLNDEHFNQKGALVLFNAVINNID